ncbi:MAG: bifunctional 4-hydroxy-2-oxoglutarate aldolase/2-dehydro-3-deoxy-phosphogluconate aldolase [Bacteroidota bacterium]
MAKYTRIEVATAMKVTGMVPVFYNPDLELCKRVLRACHQAGANTFEFTNRGDFAHELFAKLSKYAHNELDGMMLGVGSVLDAGTTSIYLQLGADFVVSPVLIEDMAKVCNRRKVLWSPGCGSLSEISKAEELGAEVVKIFPGSSVGGPSFVKAILGPCPWSSIMPTGGVKPTEENLREWFSAGVHCVGMGSQLFAKELLVPEAYDQLVKKITDTLQLIQKIRP